MSIPQSNPQRTWTQEDKMSAVMAYFLTQSSKKAEGICGVPSSTIRYWKKEAKWWDEYMLVVQKRKQAELDGKFTVMVDTLYAGIMERLVNGDVKLDKQGNPVNIPVTAKDQASILNTIMTQRQLIRGEPTSRSDSGTAKDLEKKLIDAVKSAKKEKSIPSTKVEALYSEMQEGEYTDDSKE